MPGTGGENIEFVKRFGRTEGGSPEFGSFCRGFSLVKAMVASLGEGIYSLLKRETEEFC
jgi:hypothetical protein